MTTPYDPYASATSALPRATQNQIPGQNVGINNTTINTSELNVSSAGGGVLLGYSGSPGAGNLYFSCAPGAGEDNFGNTYPSGITAISGQMQGTTLVGVSMDSTSTLTGTNIANPNVLNPALSGGTAVSLVHTMTGSAGSVLGYTTGVSTSPTFSTGGTYLWTCPTGVNTIRVQCWGASAGGGGGSSSQGGEGGGGGEYAEEPSYTVTPGQVYTIVVGGGGSGGATGFSGSNGGTTSFSGHGSLTVTANGGQAGKNYIGGAGGTGSNNTIHFDGGTGADGSGNAGGNGGGSSAGPTSGGNGGIQSTGTTGGAGGTAVPSGGAGGAGGNSASNGVNGSAPGGAGGGAGSNTGAGGGSGQNTYQPSNGTYSYYGSDAASYPQNGLRNHDGVMYQGDWQYPAAGYEGHQYSYMTLPYSTIQSDLKGKTVTSVSIRLKCLHSYYSSGGNVNMRYSSITSFGNTGNSTSGGPTDVKNFAIGEGATLTENVGLGGGIGVALQNGNASSILFGPTNGGLGQGLNYYGYWDSGANGGVIPEIIVNYTNPGGSSSTAGNGANGQVILTYGTGSTPVFALSVSATQATDSFGNTYSSGFSGPAFVTPGGGSTAATLNNQGVTVFSAGSTAASLTSSGLGLTPTGTTPGTNTTNANTAGTLTNTNNAGFTGQMPSNQTDTTPFTITSTSPVQACNEYSIPSGDPQVGTIYRLTVQGDIKWPAAAPNLINFALIAGGSTQATIVLNGSFVAGSSFVEWMLRGWIVVKSTGTSGSVATTLEGSASIYGGTPFGVALSTANTMGICAANYPVAFNTSTNQLMYIVAGLQSGATSGTIRTFYSSLERMGP